VAGDGEQTDPMTDADVATFGAEIVPDDGADPDLVRLRFEGGRTAASDLIAALAARYSIADVSIVEPDLEGVVRQIYLRQGLPE
jgi:ABC-2 type transport system ATP-binding protein